MKKNKLTGDVEEEDLEQSPDVEQIENEDGSVDINFRSRSKLQKKVEKVITKTLAEFLPDDVLASLGSDLNSKYMDYTSSRKEWEKTYIQGLDLLGFKYNQ